MNTASCYRSYPDVVKSEVARTKNVYLFPDLHIPRTTAQYWVKKPKYSRTSTADEVESIYKKKSEYLAEELAKEKAMRVLLETVRKVFPYDFRVKKLKNKTSRAQIIAAIRECLKYHKLKHCLDAIGLSKSSYHRWTSEISFCSKIKSLCDKRKPTQLTAEEVATMKKFVTSKKFAYISIASLHLLAQRTGELFCSVDTWYKYVNNFEWKRPWVKIKSEIKKTGIRSTRPNEIWHIDVTEVNIGRLKLYVQAVIDNFSRYVLAWRVTDTIGGKSTVETLNLARQKAYELMSTEPTSKVMMDPGSENRNSNVLKFITSKNLKRILAQVDVHYSNSMVEGLFHGFKNKYLYHQKIKTIEDLTRKANFYFREHNEFVPLAVLKGGRSKEVYLSTWNENDLSQLQLNKELALLNRKKKNQEPPCTLCPN